MKKSQRPAKKFMNHGFTLIEMAVVLLIVALLLGGLLPTISSQFEQRRVSETLKKLDEIQQALIGFAVINGRLPCPAVANATGVESPAVGSNCTSFSNGSFVGFVPAATLGLSPTDLQGYAIDAWGNRIRYAVTSWSSASPVVANVFTSTNGMSAAITGGFSNLSPNLLVCSTATGISATACAAGTSLTTSGVPAIIFSTGNNGAQGGGGSDENANLDNNRTFVSHVPAPSSATNGSFDDLVIWLSPNTLLNRMVAAGKLP
jgi:prepilin-type N-terminal cleavage/methylation domain-containing protein